MTEPVRYQDPRVILATLRRRMIALAGEIAEVEATPDAVRAAFRS